MPPSTLARASVVLWADPDIPDAVRPMNVRLAGLDLGEAAKEGKVWEGFGRRRSLDLHFGGLGFEEEMHEFPGPNRGRVEVPDPSGRKDPEMDIDLGSLAPFLVSGDRQRTGRVLWQIHRVSKVPLLADYHVRMGEPFLQSFGDTLGGAIASLQQLRACAWRKLEGIHTFRDPAWFWTDAAETPADTLRDWLRQAKEAKAYPADLCGEIAQLRDSQLAQLSKYGTLPGFQWYPNGDAMAAMRLWGSLTRAQRAAALGVGLDMRFLTPDQLVAMEGAERIDPTQPGVLRARVEEGRVNLAFPDSRHPEGLLRSVSPLPYPQGTRASRGLGTRPGVGREAPGDAQGRRRAPTAERPRRGPELDDGRDAEEPARAGGPGEVTGVSGRS
ncbi:MAG TPA: hypothetical protein VGN26_17775 [Armatimonadota bacterium]|jgi:hypothetical protein